MQLSDRERFDALLEKLVAGFNVPMSDARSDAYWDGLKLMPLSQFARCVETALGEHGPERLPSVPGIWALRKRLTTPLPAAVTPQRDTITYFANRLLIRHIIARGGLGLIEVPKVLDIKQQMIEFYSELIRDEDPNATPAEFVKHWVKELAAICEIHPQALAGYRRIAAADWAQKPFGLTMLDSLSHPAAAIDSTPVPSGHLESAPA